MKKHLMYEKHVSIIVSLLLVASLTAVAISSPVVTASELLSLNQPAYASTEESSSLTADKAVDGDTSTRWASQDPAPGTEWIYVDLGATATIDRVVLNWEVAYASAYEIQVSDDASTWTAIYSTSSGDGGIDDLSVSGSGRYVRVYCTERGTSYGYSLWELEVYGTGGAPDTTPPAAPTGLTATAVSSSQINLDWANNTEADLASYNVYRSTTSGFTPGTGTFVAETTVSNYSDTGLSASTTYYYKVTAVDTSGNESDPSAEASATTEAAPPPPTMTAYYCDVDTMSSALPMTVGGNLNSKTEATSAEYTAIGNSDDSRWTTPDPSWGDEVFLWLEMYTDEAVANIDSIELHFEGYLNNKDANFSIWVRDVVNGEWDQIGTTESIATGADGTITRTITVDIANYIDADGKITWGVYEATSSERLNIDYVKMVCYLEGPPDTTPPVISNVASSSITSSSATITWNTDEISDSLVKYGTSPGSYTDNKYNSTLVTSHSIALTGLTENTTYYYVVNSTDSSGNTSESSEHSFTTLEAVSGQAPYGGIPWAIPGKIEAEDYDTGGEGVAYHDTSSGNSGGAYRSEDVDIESTSDTGGGYNVGWIDTGEWLEYTVDVASSDTYNIELRVASTQSGRTFHLEFDGVDVTGSISVPNTGGWQNWTTVTVSGVNLSADQQMMRVAMDSDLFNINYISIVTEAPDTTPPVISNVASSDITSSSATITWDTDESSDSVVNYGTTTALGSTESDATMVTSHSITLTGLSEGTTYYYEVKSTDSSGNTAIDDNNGAYYTFTTTAPDTTPPAAPTGLTATAVSSSQIDLDWANNTEADLASYNVYRSTTSGFTPGAGTFVAETTVSSYSDTGLSASTTYYYKVTAVDTSGNESDSSAQASATTEAAGAGRTEPPSDLRAGLRSSRYGISPFPDSTWWVNSAGDMASRFTGATPGYVWIVGDIDEGVTEDCMLSFPSPGGSYTHVQFSDTDQNEAYLDAFDSAGHEVWLQVEPGDADVSTLIDLVLDQYEHHPCVIGFGVDVEWNLYSQNPEGVAVTDSQAQMWAQKVRSHNSYYLIFFKHWLTGKMPPSYREGCVFITDSQMFSSLSAMISDFKSWGNYFYPDPVGFQFGYEADKSWWNNLSDPPGDIGNEILNSVSNTSDLYWVDFTAYDIWP